MALKSFDFLMGEGQQGRHRLPPGCTERQISDSENELSFVLNEEYRSFASLSDGATISENVRLWPIADLFEKNSALRDGWFDESYLFFAESEYPDYFYFRRDRAEVFYFNGEPFENGVAAETFTSWLKTVARTMP